MTSYACWFWGHLSINCLITIHDNAPSLSWIFTKYANEWPPRKNNRKWSPRKKIRTWSTRKKEPEVVTTKKEPEVTTTKKKNRKWPVTFDLLTRDLWPLTLTRKKSPLLFLSPYNSNATVTWQQHWLCLHVGEQHPSQLCICWWNSMNPTQTPTTQHWSWFELYEQPPTLALDVLCASVPISRKWWPSGKHQCQEELWISMAHTQRSRSPSKHSHHLHEWLNCLQPHASTLPRSNLGGLRTLSPINISSQCEYRHYPNIHFQHQNQ